MLAVAVQSRSWLLRRKANLTRQRLSVLYTSVDFCAMSIEAKKQTEQHLIDEQGQQLLRARLPRHWRLREYRPDYGLDFALELFAEPKSQEKGPLTYETLGEHLFIQLKTVESAEIKPLSIYARGNVEKARETLDKAKLVGSLETVRFSLETSEIVTVERMGVGVPVLLVVADLSRSKCFFVCLNDYIDKILVPRHEDYRSKEHRTIHVPVMNEIGEPVPGRVALRWYGKRAKLYSAFQRFVFQWAELQYAWGTPEAEPMAKYFAARLRAYDFWTDTEMWPLLQHYGDAVQRFLNGTELGLLQLDADAILKATEGDKVLAAEMEAGLRKEEFFQLWKFLSVLPRNYEDVYREWFLPTALGYLCSYDSPRK
jgi:hypothetical protein